jgi:hypothetical protein
MNIGKAKIIIFALTITLLLSILVNIYQFVQEDDIGNITGTYSTGDGTTDGEEYITFFSDATYIRFLQSHPLESGTYAQSEDKQIYALSPDDQQATYILFNGDKVYRFDTKEPTRYNKISDTPLTININ